MSRLKGLKSNTARESSRLHAIIAMGLVPDLTVAIDGGAHVGGWTRIMALCFGRVIAFEPTPESCELLRENMSNFHNVEIWKAALWDRGGYGEIIKPGRNTLTARQFVPSTQGPVSCFPIDGLNLGYCGLIKLDVEGAELLALKGARNTIKRCQPTLVVEIGGLSKRFGTTPDEIKSYLSDRGYHLAASFDVDHVFLPSTA